MILTCDEPGCDAEYEASPATGTILMREAAALAGWFHGDACDYCPMHTAKLDDVIAAIDRSDVTRLVLVVCCSTENGMTVEGLVRVLKDDYNMSADRTYAAIRRATERGQLKFANDMTLALADVNGAGNSVHVPKDRE